MKIDMTSLDGETAGSIELDDAIFGLVPREDLIARMVRYQLAKRRAGTHQTLGRADICAHRQEVLQAEGNGIGAPRLGAGAAVSRRRPRFRPGGALACA